jgi:antitoxin component of MazEF toxin-antitoxin module
MEREEITTLSLASPNGRSLRTTVPMSIVKHLKLKEKDKLKWEIEPKNNEFLIIVRTLKRKHEKDEK